MPHKREKMKTRHRFTQYIGIFLVAIALISLFSFVAIASSPLDRIMSEDSSGQQNTNTQDSQSTPSNTQTTQQTTPPTQPSAQPRGEGIALPQINELLIELVVAGFAMYTLIIGKDKNGHEWWRAYPRLIILGIIAKFIQAYLFAPGIATAQGAFSVVIENVLPAPALIAPVLTNLVRGNSNVLQDLLILLLSNIYIILLALFFLFRTGTLGNSQKRQERRNERKTRRTQNRQEQEQTAQEQPPEDPQPAQAQEKRQQPTSQTTDENKADDDAKRAEAILKKRIKHNEEIKQDLQLVRDIYRINKDPKELKHKLEIIKNKMLRERNITEDEVEYLYKLFNILFKQKLY
jgi:flagellum-specific peptidoglycan hydrolase FlgJ